MERESAKLTCRTCGTLSTIEVHEEAFELDCESCGSRHEGRYRDDGVVVWAGTNA
ncbi:hypothetical protein [Natronomonas sp. EA1]|uniref:hypothetical protein n=1 Tax=Natronomonas sp. EA1 TaxID=3421655 RepID=UPI003EBCDDD2